MIKELRRNWFPYSVTLAGTLAVFLMALLWTRPLRATTTTLTGTIKDAFQNPINGTLVLQLPVPAQDTTTNTLVANIPIRCNIINGSLSGCPPVFDVATLQPQNLYYAGRVYDSSGTLVLTGNFVITGASFNLGAAVPTNVTTSNISYINPVSVTTSNTFTQAQFAPVWGSTTTNPASAGFIRMANLDAVNVRNFANTLNLNVISFDSSDGLDIGSNLANTYIAGSATTGFKFAPGSGQFFSPQDVNMDARAINVAAAAGVNFNVTAGNATSGNNNGGSIALTPGNKFGAGLVGDVVIGGGITGLNGGSVGPGLQHNRGTAGCATGASVGAACTTTITWAITWNDTNYTPICNGLGITSGVPVNGGVVSKSTTQVVFQTVATTAVAAQFTNIACEGMHD